jgi:putative Holliday junction resolvase
MSGTPDRHRAARTVLAFDFGTRRIGVAVGNTVTHSARELATIDTGGSDAAIAGLVAEWCPDLLVVGLPVHADGTPHAMTARARRFASGLRERFALPVVLADERHTSQVAQSSLAGQGRDGRERRDQVAAQLILQAWFDDGSAA